MGWRTRIGIWLQMTCDAGACSYNSAESCRICVVAQIAIEHGVPLLYDDRDYTAISRVRSLKTLP
jgi:hypothetical protein